MYPAAPISILPGTTRSMEDHGACHPSSFMATLIIFFNQDPPYVPNTKSTLNVFGTSYTQLNDYDRIGRMYTVGVKFAY